MVAGREAAAVRAARAAVAVAVVAVGREMATVVAAAGEAAVEGLARVAGGA